MPKEAYWSLSKRAHLAGGWPPFTTPLCFFHDPQWCGQGSVSSGAQGLAEGQALWLHGAARDSSGWVSFHHG
jgi:hypothetical protein